ncbi:MAG: hypothetical protein WED04_10990 [Promethearchaeati archaeon SRVP18_Atabeyarchaeia-1]
MTSEVIATTDFLKEFEARYPDLRFDASSLKPWFAKDKKLFLDCGKSESKNACLKKVLARQDLEEFSVLFIVKQEDEKTGKPFYSINESRFVRLGHEKPEDFINRYNKNLREPMTLSMQLFNLKPVELVGFSYVSPEQRAELLRSI